MDVPHIPHLAIIIICVSASDDNGIFYSLFSPAFEWIGIQLKTITTKSNEWSDWGKSGSIFPLLKSCVWYLFQLNTLSIVDVEIVVIVVVAIATALVTYNNTSSCQRRDWRRKPASSPYMSMWLHISSVHRKCYLLNHSRLSRLNVVCIKY